MNKFFLASTLAGGVSLTAVLVLAVQVNSLQQRLVVMEQAVAVEDAPEAFTEAHRVRPRAVARSNQPPAGSSADAGVAMGRDQLSAGAVGDPAELVENPEFREQMEQLISERQERVWKERKQEYREARKTFVEEHVWEFVNDNRLGDEKAQAIFGVFSEMTKAREQLGQDVEAGELSRAESWMEHRALREEAQESLVELLGDDLAQDLQESIGGGFHGR